MEVVEEFVSSWRQRADIDDTLGPGGNHLLDPKRDALKFHGRRIEILDPQDERLIGRRMDLAGLKMMTLDGDGNRCSLLRVGVGAEGTHRGQKHHRACDRIDTCD